MNSKETKMSLPHFINSEIQANISKTLIFTRIMMIMFQFIGNCCVYINNAIIFPTKFEKQ